MYAYIVAYVYEQVKKRYGIRRQEGDREETGDGSLSPFYMAYNSEVSRRQRTVPCLLYHHVKNEISVNIVSILRKILYEANNCDKIMH